MDHVDKETLTRMFDGIFTSCAALPEEVLAQYAELEIAGQEPDKQMPEAGAHLAECPDCAGRYAELLAVLQAEAEGEVPAVPPIRPFDLQFLPAPEFEQKERSTQRAGIPWRLDELGRLIIEFSAELLHALQPPAYRPAYATAGLKSDKSQRTLCRLVLREDKVNDLEVTITAEETQADLAHCTVIVEVDILSKGGWPHLDGTQVNIKRGERELETRLTDAFGKAIFEGIATNDLAHLIFEITPRA